MTRVPHVSKISNDYTIPEKAIFGDSVLAQMLLWVSIFATPTISLAALKTLNDNLKSTSAAAETGGHEETLLMYAAEKLWVTGFTKEGKYVDGIADGNEVTITRSGFKSTITETTAATAPGHFIIDKAVANNVAGSINVDMTASAGAIAMTVVVANLATPIVIVDGEILMASNPHIVSMTLTTATHRHININNLPSRADLFVSAIAFNNVGYSDFTAPLLVKTL
jgi:hypothetical protein